MKNVIVISPHPDDETLGCGGTILKHRNNGDNVHILFITNMVEKPGVTKERISVRQLEIAEVVSMYDVSHTLLNFPTMQITPNDLGELIMAISKVFIDFVPEVVYCVNRSDAHSDHRIIFDAVMACTKSFRYPSIKSILLYEVLSETEFAPALPEKIFLPNYYVDITEHFSRKIEIMMIFESELGEHPFPRSLRNIESLAVYRGATVGVEYAEAFQLIKHIDK